MALNGVLKSTVCNGLITFSVEWRAEQNVLNGTMIIYYDCYVDTSKCASAKVESASLGVSLTALGVPYTYGEAFAIKRTDSVGKRKVSSFVSKQITVDENDVTGSISCSFTNPNSCRAYTDLITYVDASHLDTAVKGNFTVSGLTRTTLGNIYGDLTLGETNTLSLTRLRDEFSHTVEYTCGTYKAIVCTDSKVDSFDITLPFELAKQNTESPTLSVVFSVTTLYNGTTIGVKSFTKTYLIPSSVAPKCTFTVTDGSYRDGRPYSDIYGGFVQGQSRFNIKITPELAYDSPIDEYTVQANEQVLTGENTTTALLQKAGQQDITATVTDKRGHKGSATASVSVIPYTPPVVSTLKVKRCNEDGTENDKGEYLQITFNAKVTNVNNINTATYRIAYQTTAGLDQNDYILEDYSGLYEVTGGTHIFKANPKWVYEIEVKAVDDFTFGRRTTGGSTAMTILNLLASGLGIAFGTVATLENVLESAFTFYPSGGFMFPTLEVGKDIHNITTPNIYLIENAEDFGHLPSEISGALILIVLPFGESDFLHVIISKEPNIYFRTLVDSSIGVWRTISTTTVS